jgi:hypothetical protein
MDWWRCYHGTPNDSKLAVVARRAQAKRGDVAAVWFACLDYASQNEEDRGSIDGIDAEEIAVMYDYETEYVQAILDAFRAKDMVEDDGRLTNWRKRQPEREDSTAADRKRAQRERERASQSVQTAFTSHDVTPVSRTVTHCHAPEEIREEERREEQTTAAADADEPTSGEPQNHQETAEAVREYFPDTGQDFVSKLAAAAVAADPSATDAEIAEAVRHTFKPRGGQKSAGLWLSTVPPYLQTMRRRRLTIVQHQRPPGPTCGKCGGGGILHHNGVRPATIGDVKAALTAGKIELCECADGANWREMIQ